MKLAFVVEQFPGPSVTFIIQQIAALRKRGFSVEVFAFTRGDAANVMGDYAAYQMDQHTRYLDMPRSFLRRISGAITRFITLARHHPMSALRAINIVKYGKDAVSLKTIYWAGFFLNQRFDIVHCHFGPAAKRYVVARAILGSSQPFVTTFYGYDVSRVFRQYGDGYYDELRRECPAFFAMSEDMKRRLVEHGFDAVKITVNPPGVDGGAYAWKERRLDGMVDIVSIGRLIEKKGFDDLLRAMALVRKRVTIPLRCTIVGDGPLREKLQDLARQLSLDDIINFRGYMRMEDINALLVHAHLYVQPSKTDMMGNME